METCVAKIVLENVAIKTEYSDVPCWIDIETEKVPTPAGFVMENGEPMKRRWEPILIGTGYSFDGCVGIDLAYNFSDWVGYMNSLAGDADRMIYNATREFDEMILKGRFTNARRAHLSKRGPWPGIAEKLFVWDNARKRMRAKVERCYDEYDSESKLIPKIWNDGKEDVVLTHLLRDIVDLILRDNKVVVVKGAKILNRIMTDGKFCLRLLED